MFSPHYVPIIASQLTPVDEAQHNAARLARHNMPQGPRPQPANNAERGTAPAHPRVAHGEGGAIRATISTKGVSNMARLKIYRVTFDDGEQRTGAGRNLMTAMFTAIRVANHERQVLNKPTHLDGRIHLLSSENVASVELVLDKAVG